MGNRMAWALRSVTAVVAGMLGCWAAAGQASATVRALTEEEMARQTGRTLRQGYKCDNPISANTCKQGANCSRGWYEGDQYDWGYYYMACWDPREALSCRRQSGFSCRDCIQACSWGMSLFHDASSCNDWQNEGEPAPDKQVNDWACTLNPVCWAYMGSGCC